MGDRPATHRPLEHTADVGIEVDAPSRESLFAEAAVALCDTLTRRDRVRVSLEREVALEATDGELLLVDFLNEILFLFDVEGLLFGEAEVRIDDQGGSRVALCAVLRGERYDTERHPLRSLVKAVTYHGLEIRREAADDRGRPGDGARWRARVLFDL
jgi:SHS2 domain-containing protein